MREEDADDRTVYTVVVNHEEQYSIWSADRPMPNGWRGAGMSGTKADCLAHIDRVWTDMRPLSVRRQMAAIESFRSSSSTSDTSAAAAPSAAPSGEA